jgi:hypothetical protein
MQPDEELYELAAKELANSPRQGLLVKCLTKAGGDENKGKARYIEIRVKEMKAEIAEEAKRQKREAESQQREAESQQQKENEGIEKASDDGVANDWIIALLVLIGGFILFLVLPQYCRGN